MIKFRGTENRLNEAFKLAYFIHCDREIARKIALAATRKLDAAMATQDKRSYYRAKTRNRVSLNETQLLQRLVYVESEPFERIRENASSAIDENSLLIHFVKHLVRITLRRTSFYVAIGMSRVLRNYSSRETTEIYNTVIQDPDLDRDEGYYRSCKGILMREMKKRFGEMLTLSKGPRQETLFEVQPDSEPYAELIRVSLDRFTPWRTTCSIPQGFSPTDHDLPDLTMRHSNRDDVHRVEITRMHALLHPDCYQRLIEGLHHCFMNKLPFDQPDRKLQIPRFNLTGPDDDRRPRERQPDAELSEDEMVAMCCDLTAESERRKQWKSGTLRVLVDGMERARIDPEQAEEISFRIEESEELIEIHGECDGIDTLLGAQLLTYDEQSVLPPDFSLSLSRNREIAFTLTPIMDDKGILSSAQVRIISRRTGALRSALHLLSRILRGDRRSGNDRSGRTMSHSGAFGPPLGYALTAALALAIIGSSFQYLRIRRMQGRIDQLQARQAPTIQPDRQDAIPDLTETLPIVPLTLTPGATRGAGDTADLILPSRSSRVAMLLKLTTGEYQRYRAVVFQVDERVEVLDLEIASDVTINGEKWITLILPSNKLSIGDYQVRLSGAVNDGDFEDIGKYPFRVRDKLQNQQR